MSETIFEGPAIALGPLMGGGASKTGNPWTGPSCEYQGSSVPDVRYWPANKDGMSSGRIPAFFNNPYFVLCDNFPQTTSNNTIAASQTGASTALTLVSVQANTGNAGSPGIAPNILIQP